MNRLFIRSMSCLVSLAMLLDFSGLAMPLPGPARTTPGHALFYVDDLILEGMTREDSFRGSALKELILIQDLHNEPATQRLISRVLRRIADKKVILQIFLEGAEGSVPTNFYASFPDEAARRRTALQYLNKGYLTGAEHAAITAGPTPAFSLYGVEDTDIYVHHLQSFRALRSGKRAVASEIQAIRRWIEDEKRRLYSRDLLMLDRLWSIINKDSGGLRPVFKHLEVLKSTAHDPSLSFSDLNEAVRIARQLESLDAGKLLGEQRRLIDAVRLHLDEDELGALVQTTLRYRMQEISAADYLGQLKRHYVRTHRSGRSAFPAEFPQTQRWLDLYRKLKDLDTDGILAELARRVESLMRIKARKEGHQALALFSRDWHWTERLISAGLSPGEWHGIRSEPAFLAAVTHRRSDFHPPVFSGDLVRLIRRALQVYTLAEQRNSIMVERALAEMDRSKIQRAVMIAGGFHMAGIAEILKRNGISFILLAPAIGGRLDQSPYEKRIMSRRYRFPVARRRAVGREASSFLPAARMLAAPVWLSTLCRELSGEEDAAIKVLAASMLAAAQENPDADFYDLMNRWLKPGEGASPLSDVAWPDFVKFLGIIRQRAVLNGFQDPVFIQFVKVLTDLVEMHGDRVHAGVQSDLLNKVRGRLYSGADDSGAKRADILTRLLERYASAAAPLSDGAPGGAVAREDMLDDWKEFERFSSRESPRKRSKRRKDRDSWEARDALTKDKAAGRARRHRNNVRKSRALPGGPSKNKKTRQGLKKSPMSSIVSDILEQVKSETDDLRKLELLRDAMSKDPENAIVRNQLVGILYILKRHDEALDENAGALDIIERTQRAHPAYRAGRNLTIALTLRANILLDLGRTQEAEQAALKVIDWEGEEKSDGWHLLMKIRVKEDDYAGVLKATHKILEIEPDNRSALMNRATALWRLDRNTEALESVNHILSRNPLDTVALNLKANVLLSMKDGLKALDVIENALQISRTVPSLGVKIEILLQMGREEAAVPIIEEALNLDPENLSTRMQKGRALCRMGDLAGVQVIVSELEQTSPEDPAITKLKSLVLTQLCRSKLTSGDVEGALEAAGVTLGWLPGDKTVAAVYYRAVLSNAIRLSILKGPVEAKAFLAPYAREYKKHLKSRPTLPSGGFAYHHELFTKPVDKLNRDLPDDIIKHVVAQHERGSRGRLDVWELKSAFPAALKGNDLKDLLNLSVRHAQNPGILPDGQRIPAWPSNTYVAYEALGKDGALMRVNVIARKDRVFTIYPTLGEGIHIRVGNQTADPAEITLFPWSGMVWNRDTKRPVIVKAGTRERGFASVLYHPALGVLDPIEREQLLWIAAIDGTETSDPGEAGEFIYRYEIPFKQWTDKLGFSAVAVRVAKDTHQLIAMQAPAQSGEDPYGKGVLGGSRPWITRGALWVFDHTARFAGKQFSQSRPEFEAFFSREDDVIPLFEELGKVLFALAVGALFPGSVLMGYVLVNVLFVSLHLRFPEPGRKPTRFCHPESFASLEGKLRAVSHSISHLFTKRLLIPSIVASASCAPLVLWLTGLAPAGSILAACFGAGWAVHTFANRWVTRHQKSGLRKAVVGDEDRRALIALMAQLAQKRAEAMDGANAMSFARDTLYAADVARTLLDRHELLPSLFEAYAGMVIQELYKDKPRGDSIQDFAREALTVAEWMLDIQIMLMDCDALLKTAQGALTLHDTQGDQASPVKAFPPDILESLRTTASALEERKQGFERIGRLQMIKKSPDDFNTIRRDWLGLMERVQVMIREATFVIALKTAHIAGPGSHNRKVSPLATLDDTRSGKPMAQTRAGKSGKSISIPSIAQFMREMEPPSAGTKPDLQSEIVMFFKFLKTFRRAGAPDEDAELLDRTGVTIHLSDNAALDGADQASYAYMRVELEDGRPVIHFTSRYLSSHMDSRELQESFARKFTAELDRVQRLLAGQDTRSSLDVVRSLIRQSRQTPKDAARDIAIDIEIEAGLFWDQLIKRDFSTAEKIRAIGNLLHDKPLKFRFLMTEKLAVKVAAEIRAQAVDHATPLEAQDGLGVKITVVRNDMQRRARQTLVELIMARFAELQSGNRVRALVINTWELSLKVLDVTGAVRSMELTDAQREALSWIVRAGDVSEVERIVLNISASLTTEPELRRFVSQAISALVRDEALPSGARVAEANIILERFNTPESPITSEEMIIVSHAKDLAGRIVEVEESLDEIEKPIREKPEYVPVRVDPKLLKSLEPVARRRFFEKHGRAIALENDAMEDLLRDLPDAAQHARWLQDAQSNLDAFNALDPDHRVYVSAEETAASSQFDTRQSIVLSVRTTNGAMPNFATLHGLTTAARAMAIEGKSALLTPEARERFARLLRSLYLDQGIEEILAGIDTGALLFDPIDRTFADELDEYWASKDAAKTML